LDLIQPTFNPSLSQAPAKGEVPHNGLELILSGVSQYLLCRVIASWIEIAFART